MSNYEHLMENALVAIDSCTKSPATEQDTALVDWDGAWEKFDNVNNRAMAKAAKIHLDAVWEMAFTAWLWTQDKLYEELQEFQDWNKITDESVTLGS